MKYQDLRDFIQQLEKRGELRRILAEVDPYLEVAARYGVPIVVHTAGDDHATPSRVEALAARHPDVQVVLTSGFSQVEATDRFAGSGVAGFVQKPYTVEVLLHTLRLAWT